MNMRTTNLQLSRPVWVLLTVIAGTVALRWPVLFSGFQSFGGDTVKWAGPAINFSQYGFSALDYLPTTSYGLYDVELGGRSRYLTWPFPPGYMLAGFVLVFGDSSWALRSLPLLLNFTAAIYIYLIVARAFKSEWWGVLGASCFLLIPAELYYAMQVCDTQFWLLGSIAGFYHMVQWYENRRRLDLIATTSWFLFACASSWFGYLATLVAVLFMLIYIFKDKPQNYWKAILKSPIPWLVIGVIVVLSIHITLLINALGLHGFISLYDARWQSYTGGNIVAKNIPDASWWEGFAEAIRFRTKMIIVRSLGQQIPLFVSLPLAVISILCAILFFVRAFMGLDRKLHRSCGAALAFFGLFYLTYILIFPSHMARATHNFTTQMLAPAFVVLWVYGVRWVWISLEKRQIPDSVKYVPVVILIAMLLAMSINYRIEDPTLRPDGARKRMIESARLFGTTMINETRPDDLVLSNHQGWNYDNNIMKFTARRTVTLKLFDLGKIKEYASDPRLNGVVFVYREKRKHEPDEPFEILENYLSNAAKSIEIITDPSAYPELTIYRLK